VNKLKFLVSLPSRDNGYQREQETIVKGAGNILDIDMDLVYAGGDAITQSQQLLGAIQSDFSSRPDAIIFEPVTSTGLCDLTHNFAVWQRFGLFCS
jgi:hypothetical protein